MNHSSLDRNANAYGHGKISSLDLPPRGIGHDRQALASRSGFIEQIVRVQSRCRLGLCTNRTVSLRVEVGNTRCLRVVLACFSSVKCSACS